MWARVRERERVCISLDNRKYEQNIKFVPLDRRSNSQTRSGSDRTALFMPKHLQKSTSSFSNRSLICLTRIKLSERTRKRVQAGGLSPSSSSIAPLCVFVRDRFCSCYCFHSCHCCHCCSYVVVVVVVVFVVVVFFFSFSAT